MKNFLLSPILNLIPEMKDLVGGVFSLALYKNTRLIEDHLKGINELKKPSDEYKSMMDEYNDKRKEMADIDTETNKPKTQEQVLPDGSKGFSYIITIPARQKEVDTFLNKLRKDNKKEFDAYEEKIKEYQKVMDTDCGLDFVMVEEIDLPSNMSVNQMFAFNFMINLNP